MAQDEVTPSDPEEDRRSIREARRLAASADVVVLAIGGNEQTSREAWVGNHLGDRASLDMVGRQDELVDAIAATGKPIVALLFSGRPVSIRNLAEKAAAIFECWYLGQESGRAVADVVFGDVNPGGKLPITIPRSVGHVPAYYNHKPSARRGYLFDDVTPLFPFGYGLSYTTFAFDNRGSTAVASPRRVDARVDRRDQHRPDRRRRSRAALHPRCGLDVTRPVKELKGFQRVTLEPGETRTVALDITPDRLAFWNIDMEFRVEPGEFLIMVGSSSRDEDLQTVQLMVGEDGSNAG